MWTSRYTACVLLGWHCESLPRKIIWSADRWRMSLFGAADPRRHDKGRRALSSAGLRAANDQPPWASWSLEWLTAPSTKWGLSGAGPSWLLHALAPWALIFTTGGHHPARHPSLVTTQKRPILPSKKGMGVARLLGKGSSWRTRPARVLPCSTGLIAWTSSEKWNKPSPSAVLSRFPKSADTRASSWRLLHDCWAVLRMFFSRIHTRVWVFRLPSRNFAQRTRDDTPENATIIILHLYTVLLRSIIRSSQPGYAPVSGNLDDQRSSAGCSRCNHDRLPALLHADWDLLPGRAMSVRPSCQIYQIVGYQFYTATAYKVLFWIVKRVIKMSRQPEPSPR